MPEIHRASADVRAECLDHVNRMVLRAAPFAIPGAALLAFIVGDAVPLERRIAWLLVVAAGTTCSIGASLVHAHRRRLGRPPLQWSVYAAAVITASSWSSVVWIAFPGPDDQELRAVVLLFSLGVSASSVVSSAASRARFFAYQIPMAVPLCVTYWGSTDQVTRLLGVAIPLYMIVGFAMHREVHGIVTSEMALKHEIQAANVRLSQLALHDSLTGLHNRAAFSETVDAAVAQSRRTGEHLAVLFFDLDRFKSVNDAFGHAVGDAVLVEVARRVVPLLRGGDLCARLGGDEFAVLLRGLADPADTYAVAERLRFALAAPMSFPPHEVSVSSSIGIATTIDACDSTEELLRDADTAQYRAKQSGGNAIVVFDASLRRQLERRVSAESELRAAIAAGQVVAWYQPQVDLTTGRIVGAEALARWIHPERGVIPASEFIATARECGLLDAIDLVVVRQAMESRVRLRSFGAPDDFRIWINVGARWIIRGEGCDLMRNLVAETGSRPSELGVEITEAELLHDLAGAADQLRIARRAGMEMALDDFGTGHSSITLLRRLPIDVIKVDRSFVGGIVDDQGDRAIVAAICDLARTLGRRVVAEGVETEAQLELLRSFGCDGAQGYLFAHAMPLDALVPQVCAARDPLEVATP